MAAPPLRLTRDPADDTNPVWSPDGSSIAFLRKLEVGNQFGLMLLPALGGKERKLAEVSIPFTAEFYSPYLAWTPDTQSLIVPTTYRLNTRQPCFLFPPAPGKATTDVSAQRGNRRSFPGGISRRQISCLPARMHRAIGGERFICSGWTWTARLAVNPAKWSLRPGSQLQVKSLTGHAWPGRRIAGSWSSFTILGSGPSRSQWKARNPARGQAVMAVETGSEVNFITSSLTSPRLVYALRKGGGRSIWRMHIPDRNTKGGPPERMFASTRGEFAHQYSPDGNKVAFESKRGGNLEIWVCGSDGQGLRQLTSMGSSASGVPTWSPTENKLPFTRMRRVTPRYLLSPAEGGATRRLTSLTAGAMFPRWSRDGKWIYFSSKESGATRIWKAPSGGGQAVQVTDGGGLVASESPDGNGSTFPAKALTPAFGKCR